MCFSRCVPLICQKDHRCQVSAIVKLKKHESFRGFVSKSVNAQFYVRQNGLVFSCPCKHLPIKMPMDK